MLDLSAPTTGEAAPGAPARLPVRTSRHRSSLVCLCRTTYTGLPGRWHQRALAVRFLPHSRRPRSLQPGGSCPVAQQTAYDPTVPLRKYQWRGTNGHVTVHPPPISHHQKVPCAGANSHPARSSRFGNVAGAYGRGLCRPPASYHLSLALRK